MLENVAPMTELSDLIFETLKQHGGWMSRLDIARAMKRPGRMPPYDMQLLDELVKAGKVEAEQRPSGPVRKTWMYRAKGD